MELNTKKMRPKGRPEIGSNRPMESPRRRPRRRLFDIWPVKQDAAGGHKFVASQQYEQSAPDPDSLEASGSTQFGPNLEREV